MVNFSRDCCNLIFLIIKWYEVFQSIFCNINWSEVDSVKVAWVPSFILDFERSSFGLNLWWNVLISRVEGDSYVRLFKLIPKNDMFHHIYKCNLPTKKNISMWFNLFQLCHIRRDNSYVRGYKSDEVTFTTESVWNLSFLLGRKKNESGDTIFFRFSYQKAYYQRYPLISQNSMM